MLIQAAVLHNYNEDFSIEDVELAEPGYHQILVKIRACGVCHTDDIVQHGFMTPVPAVLGHEGSGVVEKIGGGVSGILPGDHVVLTFPSCGHCPNCLAGHNNNCYDNVKLNFGGRLPARAGSAYSGEGTPEASPEGATPLSQNGKPLSIFFGQSSFATYSVADTSGVVVVDKDVDLRLLAPLGCGIQTGAGTVINTLSPAPGDSIVVFGIGGVGLSGIMAAKASGCTTIIAVCRRNTRAELVRELGATHIINSSITPDIAAEVKKIIPEGLDFALDTTGNQAYMEAAFNSLRKGGKGAGVAVTGKMPVDNWTNLFRSKSWTHVIEGDSMPQLFIPRLIRMYKAGIFPIDKIVSCFSFTDINGAFKASHDGRAIKAVVTM
jgi:aryl-alcohol dehydrogenase